MLREALQVTSRTRSRTTTALSSPRRPGSGPGAAPGPPRERFLHLDRYRVDREWKRYEGTPQRDLFRELRERFLERHRRSAGWALEIGPGPGRFTPWVGDERSHRVLLDLSQEALCAARRRFSETGPAQSPLGLIRGDAARPPLHLGTFRTVVTMGNTLGFAGSDWRGLVAAAVGLAELGGTVVLEIAPAVGEYSRYLARLPPGAVGRLLRAPVRAVVPRVAREGFGVVRATKTPHAGFHRITSEDLHAELRAAGAAVDEVLSVAPSLGAKPERIAEVRKDPIAWQHLLELEEHFGRHPDRRDTAAAVLIALTVQERRLRTPVSPLPKTPRPKRTWGERARPNAYD